MSAPVIDPEFRDVIPPLSEEEAAGLEDNILAHGCRVPLDVWRGILLDGHHRLAICEKHGIEYRVAEIDLLDRHAAMVWIAKNQRDRRNVTPYQRCELGFVIEANLPSRPGERSDRTSGQKCPEVYKPSVAAPPPGPDVRSLAAEALLGAAQALRPHLPFTTAESARRAAEELRSQ